MIRTEELRAADRGGAAIDAVTLALPPGTVYGLLGPATPDRSLLLQILGGIRPPDGGRVTVLDFDPGRDAVEVRRRVAFLPRDKEAYLGLRAGELLRFYLGFFPAAASPDAVLAEARLDPRLRLRDATPAQRARLLLAGVLARRAELVLLDEPTAELDPGAAETVLSRLAAGAGPGGRGVVLVSGRIDEVQRICDRIGIMVDGRLVLDSTVDGLLDRWRRIRVGADLRAAHELADAPGTRALRTGPDGIELVTDDLPGLEPTLSRIPEARVKPMSLREIYLEIVSRAA